MSYYVIEEDYSAEYSLHLADLRLNQAEDEAMLLGRVAFVPSSALMINLRCPPSDKRTDYLSVRYPLVSLKLKELIEENVHERIFFRLVLLTYNSTKIPYFLIIPPKVNCIVREKGDQKQQWSPGGLTITGGFRVRNEQVKGADFFRVEGLSNRKIVISEKMKKLCEANKILGIEYTLTDDYQDSLSQLSKVIIKSGAR